MNDLNDIGTRIKQLREEKKLTQAELGKLIGSPQGTVGQWERQKDRIPSRKYLNKLSEIFNVSIDYLLGNNRNEKLEKINHLGRIQTRKFNWVATKGKTNKFSIIVEDDFLEPIAKEGDECIFEESIPKNGDVVIVRYPKDNVAIVRIWRELNNQAMLCEINLEKIEEPYFFRIEKRENNKFFVDANGKKKVFIVVGKLVLVRKKVKHEKKYMGISYTFS